MIATILRENAQMENVTANQAGNCKTVLVKLFAASINLHNYFNLYVCLSLRRRRRWRRRHVPLSSLQLLLAYDKVSLIKVGWYVLRVKNIHSWSPPDPLGP